MYLNNSLFIRKNFKTKNYPFKTFDDELGIESFNDLEDDFGGDIYFSSDE